MPTSNSIARLARRLLLPAVVALLTGCQSLPPAVGVTSPPPPRIGSAPISAYDDYALAISKQVDGSHLEAATLVYLR